MNLKKRKHTRVNKSRPHISFSFDFFDHVRERTIILFLLATTFLVYTGSINNDFVYDDMIVIKQENALFDFNGLTRAFTEPHYPFLPYYRPVTRITFIAEKNIFSDTSAVPFHITNILIASVLSVVVYKLLSLGLFSLPRFFALTGALLFILHPVTSSSVYPAASGRETLLPVLCMISSLYYFLQPGKRQYLMSVFLFALALFGKEQAVIFPAVLFIGLIVASAQRKLISRKKQILLLVPFLLVEIGYLIIRWGLFKGSDYTFSENPLLVLLFPVYSLQQIIAPFIALHYEPVTISSWFSWGRIVIVLAFVGLLFYAVNKNYKVISNKWLFFWIGLFFIGFLPNANILVQDVPFDERYILLSLLGVIGLLMTVISQVAFGKSVYGKLAVWLIIIFFASVSVYRAGYFRNNIMFTKQWVKTSSEYFLSHYNLARSYEEEREYIRAIEHFKKSIALNPSWSSSYLNLGAIYLGMNNYKQALQNFEHYTSLEPASPKAYYHLGLVHLQTDNLDEAVVNFQQAILLDPSFSDAYNNLGVTLDLLGNKEKARENYQRALMANPDNISAKENLEMLQEY